MRSSASSTANIFPNKTLNFLTENISHMSLEAPPPITLRTYLVPTTYSLDFDLG